LAVFGESLSPSPLRRPAVRPVPGSAPACRWATTSGQPATSSRSSWHSAHANGNTPPATNRSPATPRYAWSSRSSPSGFLYQAKPQHEGFRLGISDGGDGRLRCSSRPRQWFSRSDLVIAIPPSSGIWRYSDSRVTPREDCGLPDAYTGMDLLYDCRVGSAISS